MKTVFILSDANRWDYLQYMPYLSKKAQEELHVKKIIPGIGFCEISEYLSGIPSVNNGNLFQITFNGEFNKKKYNGLNAVATITNRIPKIRWKVAHAIDSYLMRYGDLADKDILNVRYAIPVNMINYFSPTESRLAYDDPDFFRNENILYRLKDKGYTYDIEDFVKHNKIKGTDEERINRLKEKIKEKKLKDFTLLYVGKGEIAHDTGTHNSDFHSKLEEYDTLLKSIDELLEEKYGDDYVFIVLGDHGMVNVNDYIDVTPIIKRIKKKFNLRIGEDFIYFIDSTCFRIWLKDNALLSKVDLCVKDMLWEVIDTSVDVKMIDEKYGDLIYIIKPGIMFFPDFFNLKKKRGMHGYQNTIEEQKGMMVCIGDVESRQIESMHLYEVNDFIAKLYGL
jgi:hypothetical protein